MMNKKIYCNCCKCRGCVDWRILFFKFKSSSLDKLDERS